MAFLAGERELSPRDAHKQSHQQNCGFVSAQNELAEESATGGWASISNSVNAVTIYKTGYMYQYIPPVTGMRAC